MTQPGQKFRRAVEENHPLQVVGAVTAYCKSVLSVAQAHLTSAQVNEFKQYCAALSHENATQIKTSVKELCTTILKGSLPASERSLAAAECAKF